MLHVHFFKLILRACGLKNKYEKNFKCKYFSLLKKKFVF